MKRRYKTKYSGGVSKVNPTEGDATPNVDKSGRASADRLVAQGFPADFAAQAELAPDGVAQQKMLREYQVANRKKGVTTDGRLKPGYQLVNGKVAQVYDNKNSVSRQDKDGVWRNHVGLMKLGFDEDTAYEFAGAATGGEQEKMMKQYQLNKKASQYKKGTSGIKKAYNGIQKVQPDYSVVKDTQVQAANTGAAVSQGVSAAANLALPGLGTALSGVDNVMTGLTKDGEGNYKSDWHKAADSFNPMGKFKALASGNMADFGDSMTYGLSSKLANTKFGKKFMPSIARETSQYKQEGMKREAERVAKNQTFNNEIGGVEETEHQKTQIMKKGGKAKYKTIEIEGKAAPEIHTDKDFNLKNLGDTPHSQGGDKVVAETGDVVFPTQNNPAKYKMIMEAIEKGDTATLKAEQAKLPKDNSTEKNDGGTIPYDVKGIKPKFEPDWFPVKSLASLNMKGDTQRYTTIANSIQAPDWSGIKTLPKVNMGNTGSTGTGTSTMPDLGGLGNLGELTGIANKVMRSMEKPEKVNRRYLTTDKLKYTDRSEPNRKESEQAMKAQQSTARNLSGGNAANYRANAQAANMGNYTRQEAINNQEMAKADEVQRVNTDMTNRTKQANTQLDIQYDDMDDRNRAAIDAYRDVAAEDIANYSQNKTLMKNKKEYNDKSLEVMNNMYNYGYNNGEFNWNGDIASLTPTQQRSVTETIKEKRGNTTHTRTTRSGLLNRKANKYSMANGLGVNKGKYKG